jgi:hypothetical protein
MDPAIHVGRREPDLIAPIVTHREGFTVETGGLLTGAPLGDRATVAGIGVARRATMLGPRRAAVAFGVCSVLMAAPAWAGSGGSGNSSTSMASSGASRSGAPLKVTIPGLGGRKIELAYSGPLAPWKAFQKGERQGSISVVGPRTQAGQTVRTAAVTAAHEGVGRGGVKMAWTHAGADTNETKSLDVGASVERRGFWAATTQHATFESQRSRADGSESRVTVSGRLATAPAEHATSKSTSELRAESSSRRATPAGFEHETRSASLSTTKGGNGTKLEGTASRVVTAANGRFQEHGVSVRVGEQAAGGARPIVAKVGRVEGRDGVAEMANGAILKGDTHGELSAKVVNSGQNRTRSMTQGDRSNQLSLLARARNGILGEKNPAATAFEKGVPVTE